MCRFRVALALAAALAASPATGRAEAKDDLQSLYDKLQPYRAVYDVRQVAKPGATLAIKSARMTTETRIGCKDIESASSTTMSFLGRGGHTVTLSAEEKAQLSRDGRSYRYSSRVIDDGRDARRHEAEAVLETRDGPGKAAVRRGAPEALKLARGTVLPGTHNLRVMAAAAAGKTEVKHRVFLGEDDLRIGDITTTIKGPGTSPANAALGDFAGKPGRAIHEAVRGVGANMAGFSRTTESFVTDDGVIISTTWTMRGVELAGTLVKIEKLPKPTCP
jgi:hypothetical protein